MYVHQVHSLAMDGADQSAHDVPKVLGRVPKDLTPWPQKLQCVLAHGVLLCMFNVLNVVHAGANAAMTCLMRAMQLLEGGFSGILYLQVDGGSENWNKVLFALVDLWFDLYPNLQTVIVSRLPVGHTHIDIDRFFSYLNSLLFGSSFGGRQAGANVLTREAFEKLFHDSMVANKDTMLLKHVMEDVNVVYDFWDFLEPHLYSGFSGYGSSGNVHVIKYDRRGSGPPHVCYKYWHQSSTWMPADGSSIKILETRPDLSDLSCLKLEKHVNEYPDVLLRLQKPLLTWLHSQRPLGLVTDDDINSWKAYFRSLHNIETPTFPALFPCPSETSVPACNSAPSSVVSPSVSSSSASASASSSSSSSSSSHSNSTSESTLAELSSVVVTHQAGDEVEPVTYPGYSRATRKRKRKELTDTLDRTLKPGRFAMVDLPNDDVNFHLRLCLVKITAVHDDYITFQWYTYSGYPKKRDPQYNTTWTVQVLAGEGQKVDTAWCYNHSVVLAFDTLTRSRKIPNNRRDAPLRMLLRAVAGEFGPLPQDRDQVDKTGESSGSSDDDDPLIQGGPICGNRRSKQRVK